ncbi:DAK2 domain-containing protein [Spongisporangium articulatum]|uniref:DAK2 domain-containing protein n=1 Tax=Spongisporangium articulatum TaxID=3362603 RepID=A0ABW8AN21_9ACTN
MSTVSARRWAVAALGALGEAREEIDALNVFPVPDGDTGTNMYLTLEAAVMAAATVPEDAPVGRLADAFARGALLGARGNSGVIGAQMLRGWADVLADRDRLDAAAAVQGLQRADEQAWKAVNDPVEGTILSVSRAAAQAAAEALRGGGEGGRLREVVEAAVGAARAALARTPEQLPALAAAGVVDAGGRGFVVVLESLLDMLSGASRNRPSRARGGRPASRGLRPALPAVPLSTCDHLTAGGPGYEVMYLLNADDAAIARLRPRLSELGDSLVVVGGSGLWNVHVHVHDPGAAIEAALDFGRPHRIRVSHFSEHDTSHQGHVPEEPRPLEGKGLVACAAGPGLEELFASAGALVVPGGPGRRPSTAQLLAAVRRTGAHEVAVLPNDGDTHSVAQAAAVAARAEGVRVTVLPTRAQVQGLAAVAVHDPARDFQDDVVAMSSAAGQARDGAVTVAVKAGLTTAGECREGDVLGVVDGDFAVIGSDLEAVAVQVVENLLTGGGELVTLVVGAGGHDGLGKAVAAHLHRTNPRVEVSVLAGGQPRYPLLVGVE